MWTHELIKRNALHGFNSNSWIAPPLCRVENARKNYSTLFRIAKYYYVYAYFWIYRWYAYGYRTPTNYWSVHQKHIDDIFLSNKSDGLFVLRLRFVNSILNSIITRLCYIGTATAVVVGVGHCMLSLTFSPNRSLALAPFDQNDSDNHKNGAKCRLNITVDSELFAMCVYICFGDQTLQCKIMTKKKKSTKQKNNIQWNKSIFNAGNNSIFFVNSFSDYHYYLCEYIFDLDWTEGRNGTRINIERTQTKMVLLARWASFFRVHFCTCKM